MGAGLSLLSAACFDGTPPGRPQLDRKRGEKKILEIRSTEVYSCLGKEFVTCPRLH